MEFLHSNARLHVLALWMSTPDDMTFIMPFLVIRPMKIDVMVLVSARIYFGCRMKQVRRSSFFLNPRQNSVVAPNFSEHRSDDLRGESPAACLFHFHNTLACRCLRLSNGIHLPRHLLTTDEDVRCVSNSKRGLGFHDESWSKSLIVFINSTDENIEKLGMKDESWSKSLIKFLKVPDENHNI